MSESPSQERSEKEWREVLTPEQYRVTRQCGTEPAFSGKYNAHKADGVYVCVACGKTLFDSRSKFDSGSGWPSFTQPGSSTGIATRVDNSYGMQRTEVRCAFCESHLGHVFSDGPAPGGLRYCINSAALQFNAREEARTTDKTDRRPSDKHTPATPDVDN